MAVASAMSLIFSSMLSLPVVVEMLFVDQALGRIKQRVFLVVKGLGMQRR